MLTHLVLDDVRARPLPPDERRRAIIAATLPLLREHGTALPTRQIAKACGVAEGTLFKAFESKEDLIASALHSALSIEALAERLASIPEAHTLPEVVRGVLSGLDLYLADARALLALTHLAHRPDAKRPDAKGPPRRAPGLGQPSPDGRGEHPDPRIVHQLVCDKVSETLSPYANRLTVAPEVAAATLIALAFGAHHPFAGSPLLDIDTIAAIALRGLARES